MSAIRSHLEEYLALRRSLGFKLGAPGQMLAELVGYLRAGRRADGHHRARAGLGHGPGWRGPGLLAQAAVGGAAVRALPGPEGPRDRGPPPGLLPGPSSRRAVPYLYSGQEVAALMAAAAGSARRSARRPSRR